MNAMRARSWPRCGRTPGTSLAPTFRTRGTASCDPDCVRPQRRKFRLEWRCSLRLSDLYVEAWHICANGSEQNCTVLPLLWAMRTVTGLVLPGLPHGQRQGMLVLLPLREDSRMQRKRVALLLAGLLLAITALPTVAQTKKEDSSMPKVGDMAPDFTLKHFDGTDLKDVKLSDYRGKKNVVLAFYIFAFTGG